MQKKIVLQRYRLYPKADIFFSEMTFQYELHNPFYNFTAVT